eukprot:COSAG01_NODE_5496_length_4225_cov_1.890936_4_plen_193_part_00
MQVRDRGGGLPAPPLRLQLAAWAQPLRRWPVLGADACTPASLPRLSPRAGRRRPGCGQLRSAGGARLAARHGPPVERALPRSVCCCGRQAGVMVPPLLPPRGTIVLCRTDAASGRHTLMSRWGMFVYVCTSTCTYNIIYYTRCLDGACVSLAENSPPVPDPRLRDARDLDRAPLVRVGHVERAVGGLHHGGV